MDRLIRNSAKALIIRDGKMLVIKIKSVNEEWYIMPGGGQETEELLSNAVCREVAEELGINVEAKELVFVIEGVQGESFHRVDLVFLCKYIGIIKNAELQSDTNQIGYDWIEIKSLNHLPLYPSKLRRQIMNFYEGKEYKVYLGNEEIGDPEIRSYPDFNHTLATVCSWATTLKFIMLYAWILAVLICSINVVINKIISYKV